MIAFIQERIFIVNWFRFFYSGFFMIDKEYITSERHGLFQKCLKNFKRWFEKSCGQNYHIVSSEKTQLLEKMIDFTTCPTPTPNSRYHLTTNSRSISILSLMKNNPVLVSDYPFPLPENPVKRSDWVMSRKSHIWRLFDKITPYLAPIPTPRAAWVSIMSLL